MKSKILVELWLALLLCGDICTSLSSSNKPPPTISRRGWSSSIVTGASLLTSVSSSSAAGGSLASKLSKRDPAVLVNSVFNVPPSAQVFPDFMKGTWDIECKYGGYLFPSTKISRDRLTANVQVPGFQKCSIAALCDLGKDSRWQMTIDETTGLENRVSTLTSQIDSNLGYSAVAEILYNPKSNPNRLSVDFVEYKTKNAERIELFFNARESEMVPETGVFVCSEYMRQVTFGTGSQVGIPRQVVGNYAHFWTWRKNQDDPTVLSGNLLTAAYLDPQDAMFFEEPSKPVVVYSHVLSGLKRKL